MAPDIVPVDSNGSHPISGRRRCARSLDPLEEALVAKPLWNSRRPDPLVHELLYRFGAGDEAGALAVVDRLVVGRRVPALTVSPDVLDELDLDHCAALVLAYIDGVTDLSRVLNACGLPRVEALRTLCALVERRIIVLRTRR
jgi:hypothetical protein